MVGRGIHRLLDTRCPVEGVGEVEVEVEVEELEMGID